MKVSLNTIKQYTDIEVSVDQLVAKINAQLGGVEEVINLGERYEKATIVKVVKCEKHPNADKLSVCEIDAGTGENVQVVCGAPNVREGIFVVWLPPTSTVPASFDDKEPFVLEARELRGVVSNGMLASAKELGIGDSHDGILEIEPTAWKPNDIEIKAGTSFAEAYGLDDTIIDIENKMFTHRPDLFGQIGVAREIAGIQQKQFTSPEWYTKVPEFSNGEGLSLEVFNEVTDMVPRFMAVAIKNIEVKPSPLWLQIELVRLGGKPINNIVDVTNYVMLLTAQPTHAYDYDKIRGAKIGARMAKSGETVKLLNGKTYELDETDIVIADGEGPVGLAGIMGGGESEVSAETKNIVLEVGNFDMYAVRRSSMKHGVFTDALTRFNKGQSLLQNDHVMSLLIQSVFDVSPGEQASEIYDIKSDIEEDESVVVTTHFINDRLGLGLSLTEMTQLLKNVEIKVSDEDGSSHPNPGEKDYPVLLVWPPFWRTDLKIPEDIVEEVGRLYGFDKLPRELPKRSTRPVSKNATRELSKTVRETLARAGANEVLTYSFVHENVIKKSGQDVSEAYQISNALSPELQYYRLSLTPSLLDKVHGNVKTGHDEFALFEIGKAHSKRADLDQDGLPAEMRRIALTVVSNKSKNSSAYYQARTLLEFLGSKLGLSLEYKTLPVDSSLTFAKPFEPKRSARIIDMKSGQAIGVIGEYNSSVKRSFKLPEYAAGFELLPEAIELALEKKENNYKPLSKYPSTDRDICFQVSRDVQYNDITTAVSAALATQTLESIVIPVDIYQPEEGTSKNITVRLKLTSHEKTLSGDEANEVVNSVVTEVVKSTGARVV